MEINVPRKDRGYCFPSGKGPGPSHVADRTRGLVLVRLLMAGERETAQALGLLPDGDDPGWELGPVVEGGLRRLGVVA